MAIPFSLLGHPLPAARHLFRTLRRWPRYRFLGLCLLLAWCLGLMLAIPACRWRLIGLLRWESFYDGRPTSYWRAQIQALHRDPSREVRVYRALRSSILGKPMRLLGIGEPVPIPPLYRTPVERDPEAVPVLAELLGDADATVRLYAVGNLAWMRRGAEAAVPALVRLFGQEHDPEARALSARALGAIGPGAAAATPALRAALTDVDLLIRVSAARALWQIDRQAAPILPVLYEALASESWSRELARDVLADMGPGAEPGVPAPVVAALRSRDPDLWNRFLPEVRAAVPVLVAKLKDRDQLVRARAIALLGNLGPQPDEAAATLRAPLEEKAVGRLTTAALSRFAPQAESRPGK